MPSAQPTVDIFSAFFNTVDGKLSSTEKTRHSINPATGKPNPPVPVSTLHDVDLAVRTGKRGFEVWRQTSLRERQTAVLEVADVLDHNKADLAKLLTIEQGKPHSSSVAEIEIALRWFRELATTAEGLNDETVKEDDATQIVIRHVPLGLVIGIIPWNFPILCAAILTGNVIILKPSPFTPYCGLKIGELVQHIFPPGVVQVLSGDDNLGPWLTRHPGPDKIAFTGSSITGKKVMESAAKTLKRITLELGGNDAAIVCSDIDVEATARKIGESAFNNAGQVCTAIKRIYVHENIYPEFRLALARYTQQVKMGEGNMVGVDLGPVQNGVQFERVTGFLDNIEKENWKVLAGSSKYDINKPGYFVIPTVIDQPPETSRIVTEEAFGPIVPLLVWKEESDVILRSNNTKMGLGASVWSRDSVQASRLARQLEAGTVWINTHLELDPNAPFGGHKESGIGYEFGIGGLKSFCNVQTLFTRKK